MVVTLEGKMLMLLGFILAPVIYNSDNPKISVAYHKKSSLLISPGHLAGVLLLSAGPGWANLFISVWTACTGVSWLSANKGWPWRDSHGGHTSLHGGLAQTRLMVTVEHKSRSDQGRSHWKLHKGFPSKSVLLSHLLPFHWPRQVTWWALCHRGRALGRGVDTGEERVPRCGATVLP